MPTLNTIVDSGELNFSIIRGFDRLDPEHMGVPSYNETTRTFTLTPNNDYFVFWAGRKKFTKTSPQSVTWNNVTGYYYFYFDTSGVLQSILASSITEGIFLQSAICGLIYWNATEGKAIVQAVDEQHGIDIRPSVHARLHNCEGAKWSKGGDINGITNGSNTYTGIDALVSYDEDIRISTNATTTHPFIWREGSDGAWVEGNPNNEVGYQGISYTYWNEFTGGA